MSQARVPELTDRYAELLAAASLTRAVLAREARGLVAWVASLGLLSWYAAVAVRDAYSTPDLRQAAAALERTPGVAAFTGPGLGLGHGDPGPGALLANSLLLYVALATGVYAVLLVLRSTRATEESGQAEIVRTGVLRRGAEGAVVLLVLDVALSAMALGVLMGLLAAGAGLAGSLLLAAAGAGTGAVMGGVALLVGQLAPSARSARALSLLMLLVAFQVRTVGDVLAVSDLPGGWVSLLSPLGWAQAVGPWTQDRWWWVLVSVAVADGLMLLALRVSAGRDLGVSALSLPDLPGAERCGPRGPLALAARTHASESAWWVVGGAGLGLLYGSLTGSVQDALGRMVQDSPYLRAVLGGSLTPRSFLSTVMLCLVLLAAAAGVSLVLTTWRDEVAGRADVMVVAPRRRSTRLGAAVVLAAAGSLTVLLVGGLCLGGAGALTAGSPGLLTDSVLAALGAWPACLLLIGVAAVLIGCGRWVGTSAWSLYGGALTISVLASLLDLPQTVRDLSPFEHLPQVLTYGLGADGVSWVGAAVTGLLAVALAGLGTWLVGRRELR